MPDTSILGIESSCDETGAAVVRSGREILSNVVASQIATHQPYGGVVPELASREHLRAIVPVVRQALAEAGQTYASVDAIAVTQGPGLAGALLVGIILTPLFCWYVRGEGDAWLVNAVVSTVAFPFWAYLMGAVAFTKFHDGNLAVILILTFTAVSGLVAPVAATPKAQEQANANPKDGPRLVEPLKA